MDKLNIIHDLQEWIEHNLHTPLPIDCVADKSGYSKWHIQRLYRELTGYNIASYIRLRRLTKAAIELKTTNLTVGEIAFRNNFSSQAAFTRTFNSHYGTSPGEYRKSADWDSRGMIAPVTSLKNNYKIIMLPEKMFKGRTVSCDFQVGSADLTRLNHMEQFRRKLLRIKSLRPPVIYGLHQFNLAQGKNDITKILYTAAIEDISAPPVREGRGNIHSAEGCYAKYSFHGSPSEFINFSTYIYQNYFPSSGLIRRHGCDIERFHTDDDFWDSAVSTLLHCDYLIPISM